MMQRQQFEWPRHARRTLLMIFLLSCSSVSHAEIAVAISPSDPQPRPLPYVLASLTDSGDPLESTVWNPFNLGSDSRVILNPEGSDNGDGIPSIAYDVDHGKPVVAWSKNSEIGFDLVISRFVGTRWTDLQYLAESTNNELDPHFGLTDEGDPTLHLLYWIDGPDTRVVLRRGDADGTNWQPPIRVSGVDEVAMRPAGVVVDGVLHVVYESHAIGASATTRQIVVATDTGGDFSTEIVTTTHYDGKSWPQIHTSEQGLWIEWIDADGEMTWTRRAPDGSWSSVQMEPFGDVEDREFHVRGRVKAAVNLVED